MWKNSKGLHLFLSNISTSFKTTLIFSPYSPPRLLSPQKGFLKLFRIWINFRFLSVFVYICCSFQGSLDMKWDIAEHCATPQKYCATPQKYCAHPLKSQTPQATSHNCRQNWKSRFKRIWPLSDNWKWCQTTVIEWLLLCNKAVNPDKCIFFDPLD